MRFVVALLPLPVIAAIVVACSDANQNIIGGNPLFDAALPSQDASDEAVCIPNDAGDQTWTSLYQDFFGPTGTAQCGASQRTGTSGTSSCHHDGTGSGALASGFICGDTQETCYEGITSPQAKFLGTQVVAVCNPSGSYLTHVLRHADGDGGTTGIMPFEPDTIVFSDNDMARISGWISAGAQNN